MRERERRATGDRLEPALRASGRESGRIGTQPGRVAFVRERVDKVDALPACRASSLRVVRFGTRCPNMQLMSGLDLQNCEALINRCEQFCGVRFNCLQRAPSAAAVCIDDAKALPDRIDRARGKEKRAQCQSLAGFDST